MKSIPNLLVLLAIAIPYFGMSQTASKNELTYGVYRNHPPISISKEQLLAAKTLLDLNKKYEAAWVKTYVSVEIQTTYKGEIRKAVSNDFNLSAEQIEVLNAADAGADIIVRVQYLPENTLKHNDIQELGFTFSVDPENQAEFPGGQLGLQQYLNEKLGNLFSTTHFGQYQLSVLKFTVDETGQVSSPNFFWKSGEEKADQLLMETISQMPRWKPAQYANGVAVKQEFVLTAGDMESCVVNLINIDSNSK